MWDNRARVRRGLQKSSGRVNVRVDDRLSLVSSACPHCIDVGGAFPATCVAFKREGFTIPYAERGATRRFVRLRPTASRALFVRTAKPMHGSNGHFTSSAEIAKRGVLR
jgi:hypothetical protein